MTRDSYLEITYRHGRPLAAYLYLGGGTQGDVARSRKAGPGLIVDYDSGDRPVGIEITSPSAVSAQDINRLLEELHQQKLGKDDLAPLLATG